MKSNAARKKRLEFFFCFRLRALLRLKALYQESTLTEEMRMFFLKRYRYRKRLCFLKNIERFFDQREDVIYSVKSADRLRLLSRLKVIQTLMFREECVFL